METTVFNPIQRLSLIHILLKVLVVCLLLNAFYGFYSVIVGVNTVSYTHLPVQLHLLKMFSYAKGERALAEIRKSLTAYFAHSVEEDMDKLWDEGLWDQDKNCLLYTSRCV